MRFYSSGGGWRVMIAMVYSCCGLGFVVVLMKFQKMNSGTKLIARDTTGASTPANLMSPRPACDGRHPGAGFGEQSRQIITWFLQSKQAWVKHIIGPMLASVWLESSTDVSSTFGFRWPWVYQIATSIKMMGLSWRPIPLRVHCDLGNGIGIWGMTTGSGCVISVFPWVLRICFGISVHFHLSLIAAVVVAGAAFGWWIYIKHVNISEIVCNGSSGHHNIYIYICWLQEALFGNLQFNRN